MIYRICGSLRGPRLVANLNRCRCVAVDITSVFKTLEIIAINGISLIGDRSNVIAERAIRIDLAECHSLGLNDSQQ